MLSSPGVNSAALQALAASVWPYERVRQELERTEAPNDYADSLVRRAVPREPKIERCLISAELA